MPASFLPVMSALAQGSRWHVFELLLGAGDEGMLQGEIAAKLGITKNLLSVHLKIMQSAGLVSAERIGREVTYRATPEPAMLMAKNVLHTVGKPHRRS
jgi:ArsR family transcriptional regulator